MKKVKKICVVGLGYVGLPLAIQFAKKHQVIGIDLDEEKVKLINNKIDPSGQILENEFTDGRLKCYSTYTNIKDCDYFIITVPTPVDCFNRPNLKYLLDACKNVGRIMRQNSIIIIESTIFPTTTEKICLPIISKYSGIPIKKIKIAFSPERVSPGDKEHTVYNTPKLISAIDEETVADVINLYKTSVTPSVIKCSSIKIAEAAKMLENVQRDVKISLMNELSQVFKALNIDMYETIEVASTKWNFMTVKPGLVGGHCIGVDSYYFIDGAIKYGINLELVKTAREINVRKTKDLVSTVKDFCRNIGQNNIKIGILGVTYKENIGDIRNSQALKFYDMLLSELDCAKIYCYDPFVQNQLVSKEEFFSQKYHVLAIMVNHSEFYEISRLEFLNCIYEKHSLIIDLHQIFFPYKEFIDDKNYITL